jgi:hypothetical protein
MKALLAAALLVAATPAIAVPDDRWGAEIAEASARFAIPGDWIRRVIRAESGGQAMRGGRPVVSAAGAMGLMQLMPGTWRDVRALLGLGRDPFDPRDNILAGTFYLRSMYDRFGYPGLFAAYNAGPSRYAAFLAGSGPLPAETRAYVEGIAGSGPPAGTPPQRRGARLFAIGGAGEGNGTALRALPPPPPGGLFVEIGRSAAPGARAGGEGGLLEGGRTTGE